MSESSADSRRQALTVFTSPVINTHSQSLHHKLSSILHAQTALQVTDQYNVVAAFVIRMPSFLLRNQTNELACTYAFKISRLSPHPCSKLSD
jgi:hypothetical protein